MKGFLKRFADKKVTEGSYQVNSKTVEKFVSDPNFPFFISFPRTGSHWVRMVMELYFETPSLVRVFFYSAPKKYTCYHTHALESSIERDNVIYLYRNPLDTIFSQVYYENNGNVSNDESLELWTNKYAHHLKTWVFDEKFTKQKTLLKYENFKTDFESEFKKICSHFGVKFNKQKLSKAISLCDKAILKEKTSQYNSKIVELSTSYETKRSDFKERYKARIFDLMRDNDGRLLDLFAID